MVYVTTRRLVVTNLWNCGFALISTKLPFVFLLYLVCNVENFRDLLKCVAAFCCDQKTNLFNVLGKSWGPTINTIQSIFRVQTFFFLIGALPTEFDFSK